MEKMRFVKAREEDTDLVLETLNEATQYKNEHSDDAWGSEPWQEREIQAYYTKWGYAFWASRMR